MQAGTFGAELKLILKSDGSSSLEALQQAVAGIQLPKNVTMKVVMGNGASKLVVVPRGVAHGVVNIAKKSGSIIYFVNNQYNIADADERRLKWDALGAAFWEVEKG